MTVEQSSATGHDHIADKDLGIAFHYNGIYIPLLYITIVIAIIIDESPV